MLFYIFVSMVLEKYICDLLYRYECVIIPHFGGFVSNPVAAKANHFNHTFTPPYKQLSFNTHLCNNDGLLANYIATAKNISYLQALQFIKSEVALWEKQLNLDGLDLENIGLLSLNKTGKIIFEPSHTVNYLTSSFGLSACVSPAIKRLTTHEKTAPLFPHKTAVRKTPILIKYAAAATVVFALVTIGWNQYQNIQYNNLVAKATQQQQKVEKTIQEATFVIENPLPTITFTVAKKAQNYHIMAGSFRKPANAAKKLKQLQQKGYNAHILGLNKWNLTQVAYESFATRNEALQLLEIFRKNEAKDAWLLVKKQ